MKVMGKYIRKAIDGGASVAKIIDANKIVTASWVRIKCQYGCGEYRQCLTCPPYSPTPDYTKEMIEHYSKALLIIYDVAPEEEDRLRYKIREVVAEIERDIFLDGYYRAFGMAAGPCSFCDSCDVKRPCKYPHKARPSMEACGIDVFQTLRNLDLNIEVVKSENLPCTLCGAVLIV